MQLAQNQEGIRALKQLKSQLNENESIIQLNTTLYPTKGQAGAVNAEFYRDVDLENSVKEWISTRSSFESIVGRYHTYDNRLQDLAWPKHFATHFIHVDGILKKMENIFMFFPEVLGVDGGSVEDYFGFEFIDIWFSVFNEIVFPCMRHVFDHDSLKNLYGSLRPNLEKTIFLSSVFHEIGHRVSLWKVSPIKDERVSINKFHTDVFGELSTDMLLVNFLREFPEVMHFVFLQRIFWFGRFNFSKDTVHGELNNDNDTWISAYLWQQYMQHEAMSLNDDGLWHVNIDQLPAVFASILDDLTALEQEIIAIDKTKQDAYLSQWMKTRVPTKHGRFVFPESQRELFIRCIAVPELPLVKF